MFNSTARPQDKRVGMKMERANNSVGDKATSGVAAIDPEENCELVHATLPEYNYVRRRKCNENLPVCEKRKKRETFRRVSAILFRTQPLYQT